MSVAGVCGAGSCAAAQQATDCGSKASTAALRVDGSAVGEEASGSGGVGRTDGGDGTRAHKGHHGHRGHHVHHGHHGRHGHRGQGLVNVIRQVMEQLLGEAGDPASAGDATDTAVEAPEGDAVTVDAAAADPVVGESEGTETVEDPAEATAGESPVTDPAATADPGAESAPASRFAVKHALYAFLHTLFSTFAQGHTAAPVPEATDGEGGAEPVAPGPQVAPGSSAGYRSAGIGLGDLVAGLASDGASDGVSDGTGAGMDLTALRASFDHLVATVGGDAAVGTVTLQSFLEALLTQLGGSAPASDPVPPAGGLVTVTA